MKRTYKTAQGQAIDLDALRLANEDAIAVGNMHVNARGDQLGPGGVVIKTRNQTMDEYYQIQADPIETMRHLQSQGVSVEESPAPKKTKSKKTSNKVKKEEAAVEHEPNEPQPIADFSADDVPAAQAAVEPAGSGSIDQGPETTIPLRGNLADSVAKEAQVNQTLLKPLNKRNGIQRI